MKEERNFIPLGAVDLDESAAGQMTLELAEVAEEEEDKAKEAAGMQGPLIASALVFYLCRRISTRRHCEDQCYSFFSSLAYRRMARRIRFSFLL